MQSKLLLYSDALLVALLLAWTVYLYLAVLAFPP
jgi:hypothetical protein